MRRRGRELRDARSVRHGVAAAIFWLLPLFAFAGVLAPEMVTVVYEEQEEEIGRHDGSVVFRPTRPPRPPLVVPRNYSAGFTPLLLDIESLFAGSQYHGEWALRLSDLPSFPSARGDSLVIDDLDAYIAQLVFDDLLEPMIVAGARELWDPSIFDVIPSLLTVGNGFFFDDFPDRGIDVSDSVPVPEPGTGLLVSLGVTLLAWARRRR